MDKSALRDAASVILIRDAAGTPSVLMGQRGSGAAFMPNKFVFPGGAVDAGDAAIPLAGGLGPVCAERLAEGVAGEVARALPATAVRELWEETGLVLGTPGAWDAPPPDWRDFAETGYQPSARGLHFVFRAITPPGRPRRFDARFFLGDAAQVAGDPDDFSRASDELAHLQWIPLSEVRTFDLPFIQQVVLAEIQKDLSLGGPPEAVPFFKNDDEESLFLRIGGRVL